MTEFLLLGPVELRGADGAVVDPGPAKQRTVLAVLLADAGRWVASDTLIDRVWGEDVPAQVRPSLYAHIARIRRLLANADASARLRRGPGGYLLDVPPGQVDVHRFRQLVEQARGEGRTDAERVRMLRAALGLWRGEPLAGLTGGWAECTRHSWRERRIEAVLAWAEAESPTGEHAEVIGVLTALAAEHPLVEPLTVALMRALRAAGRGPEALACYTVLRKRLAEELGTDPGAVAQQVHQEILRGEAAPPATRGTPRVEAGTGQVVPAQLPPETRGFTGRVEELARLDGILAAAAERPAAVVVSAVSGPAGVGKTALSVHWAHRVADRFPDGQLYVNLRGFAPGGAEVTPDQAVRGFLDALGVPAQRVPVDLQARVGLYRSLLARRRVLVVLDNARDADQVRPLLPGSPTCLAVITSRDRLTGLVATEGAQPMPLDLLSPAEAHDLLTRRLGEHRVAAEPDAVQEIVARCARLPLALALTAARAATRPALPLARLAGELADAHGSLTAFTSDGDPMTDVRAVFSWSHRALGPGAARLFALLGLHPGPDISAAAAASLAGLDPHRVRAPLAELARAHLITEHSPGRYTFHDLLRAYASEQAQALGPDTGRQAGRRLLDHYLSTAHHADHLLDPYRAPITPTPPGPGVSPEQITDHAEALAWFTAEHPVLLAALRQAAETGLDTHAWRLARSMATYLQRRCHWHDLLTSQRTGLLTARRLSEEAGQPGQAHTHLGLAFAHIRLLRFEDAHHHLGQALDLFGRIGDRVGQGHTRTTIVMAYSLENRYDTEDHLLRALEDFRAAGHQVGQAKILNSLGWYHATRGDQQALTYCHQALNLLKDTADHTVTAATWDTYGYAHHQLGQRDQAADCYHHALELYRVLGDPFGEAETLTRLGDTHHAADETDTARDAWRRALGILDDLDHPGAEGIRNRLRRQSAELTEG
ncbi:AfsR/SARP family transcriptional regulator [Streptomyces sp. 2A115]|uniref:AfsR/SARP family transcriptional regulator n=1 Tax=Streptomyces sp. 2A115 TaxID=3457439 RepID=UPI003FD57A88